MEKVYRTIVEKLNNVIVVANAKGDVEYVSPSVKNLLGFEPTELLGEGWWDNTKSGNEESISFGDYIHKLFQTNGTISASEISYERQLSTALGEEKWMLWNTSLGPDESIISIGSDITKRKKGRKGTGRKAPETSPKKMRILLIVFNMPEKYKRPSCQSKNSCLLCLTMLLYFTCLKM